MKRLASAESNVYQLEVVECDCGFHLGIDATWLDQVGDFIIRCPSCDTAINTAMVFPEYSEDEADEEDEEDAIEQQRRDEKHGLYLEHRDDAN